MIMVVIYVVYNKEKMYGFSVPPKKRNKSKKTSPTKEKKNTSISDHRLISFFTYAK